MNQTHQTTNWPLEGRKGGAVEMDDAPAEEITEVEDDDLDSDLGPQTDEELSASLEEFFGFSLDDDADQDEEVEDILGGGEGEEDTPPAATETPAPVETPAAETPAVEAPAPVEVDAEAPFGRDNNGNPLNQYGMVDITQEEWDEYLADETVPKGEAQREYLNYQMELQRRQNAYQVQLQEVRRAEIAESHTFVAERFADADAATADVNAMVERVLSFLPEDQRSLPGYHAFAVKLVVADRLTELEKKYGRAGAAATQAAKATETGKQPAKRPAARVTRVEGSGTPPARTADNGTYGLTADELAFCKTVGMKPKDYAENK